MYCRKEQNRTVFLIGLMGTGKSTVGQKLAETLGWRFTDMDAAIEHEENLKITSMFETKGEVYFREIETRVLQQLAEEVSLGRVVSTGGGAVLAEANRRTMLEHGYVVALTAAPETIMARVRQDRNRPLLQGNPEERIRHLAAERKHAYDFAHLTVTTDNRNAEEIVRVIVEGLKQAKYLD